jgi:hypothetical protein
MVRQARERERERRRAPKIEIRVTCKARENELIYVPHYPIFKPENKRMHILMDSINLQKTRLLLDISNERTILFLQFN